MINFQWSIISERLKKTLSIGHCPLVISENPQYSIINSQWSILNERT